MQDEVQTKTDELIHCCFLSMKMRNGKQKIFVNNVNQIFRIKGTMSQKKSSKCIQEMKDKILHKFTMNPNFKYITHQYVMNCFDNNNLCIVGLNQSLKYNFFN